MTNNPQDFPIDPQEENLKSYFRLRLEDYFKPNHPIQKTASFLFPPLAMIKEMFSNIHINNNIPVHYPPQMTKIEAETVSVPLLWQILIYNVTYPADFAFENENLWRKALNARLAHRVGIESLFEAPDLPRAALLEMLKTQTLIDPQYIDNAIERETDFDLWRLNIHLAADFYLSLIATFDQAVTEEMIIFCAEENITLPSVFTDLTDSGFIGQLLPSRGQKHLIMPDTHLLNIFHKRHESGSYFYDACQLAERIGCHGWENYLLKYIIHCQHIRCNDWHDWLAQSGNCPKKAIPPLLVDLFFLSRAMGKFIQFQNRQLQKLGVPDSQAEMIALYQRYPLYFNQSETFQG